MMPVELTRRTFLHGSTLTAIYRVETGLQGPVFMRVDRSNYMNDKRAVVIVDAARFLKAWRAGAGRAWLGYLHAAIDPVRRRWFDGPGRDQWLPYLSLAAWRSDYKFHHAQEGFSQCAASPVPLARVGIGFAPDSVGFSNGITRTLWLLANGAIAFPVECSAESADRLQRSAGAHWAHWLTVEELTGDYSWATYLGELQTQPVSG